MSGAADVRKPSTVSGGEREVFLDAHARRTAAHRILKQSADAARTGVGRLEGDILAAQFNCAAVRQKIAADRVEHRGFSRAVRADDRGEITRFQVERHTGERGFFIDGSGIKCLGNIRESQHSHFPPCFVRWSRRRIIGHWLLRYGPEMARMTITEETSLSMNAGMLKRKAMV